MDVKSTEPFNPIEESLVKMITDFANSFRLLNKSDLQVRLWFDSLNNVVNNILDIYKICFVTKSNLFCCEDVIKSLEGIKKVINLIAQMNLKESFEKNDPEKNTLFKPQDSSSCKNNWDCNLEKNDPEELVSEYSFTFGDVDYDVIMNDLKKKKNCGNSTSKNVEFELMKRNYSNSYTQTDLTAMNFSFHRRNQMCSVGVQTDNVKNAPFSQSNFSSDYNLNDPYMCNQNYEEIYQNVHYYNDSCSYQNDMDRSYSDHTNNFSHQFQPLPCPSVSLPGRNVSAPVFLPRVMASPSSIQHSSDHHHSSVPYAITMFSSSQSYIPGIFNSSVGPPHHYLGVSPHSHKESKRSHRKSDLSLVKKSKSSLCKSNELSKNKKKEKYLSSSQSNVNLNYSCQGPMCYLAKIDLLEKACNFETSYRCFFSRIDLTSSSGKSDESMLENVCLEKSNVESNFNIMTELQVLDGKVSNISDGKSDFSDSEIQDVELSNQDISASNYCEKNNGFLPLQQNNNVPSLVNDCDSLKMRFESISNSGSSLKEPLLVPALENHNNNTDETLNVSKKMDVKLSFVNVLTTGLKIASDAKICSVKKTPPIDNSNEVEFNNSQHLKPPNVFELSHFPSLKPSTLKSIKKTDEVLYFGQCKSRLPCVFGVPEVVDKASKDGPSIFTNDHADRSSISRVEPRTNFNGKYKDSETAKKPLGLMNKGYQIKRNLSLCDFKKSDKNPKCNYQFMKYSNASSNSKNMKDDIYCSNSSNMEKKLESSMGSFNKKCKSDEVFHSRKNSMHKRRSVPGEDGWTVIPVKFRNPEPWNAKELVSKKINDLAVLSDDGITSSSDVQHSDVCPESTKINSSDSKENNFPLSCQQPFFQAVQLECQSSFYENKNSVIDDFDICHDLNESNGFSLPAITIVESVGGSSNHQKGSTENSTEQVSLSDFQVASSSHVNLNVSNDCTEDKTIDVLNADFPTSNHFLDKNSANSDNDIDGTSMDSTNQSSIFENSSMNVLTTEVNMLDDFKLSKWPSYEENDIANMLSHSSCWSELLKPDTDNEDQHLNDEDVRKSKELQEEALMLRKKIKDLQSNENEIDTENEGDFENDNPENIDPHEIFTEYSDYLSQISSWGDQIDEMERFQEMLSSDPNDSIFKFQYGSIEQFKELVARHPGKAIDLHCKLLGRSKRSNSDELYEIRRKRAEEKRQKLLNRKAAKMRELLQRVEEVKQAQLQIIEERKCRIDFKLRKAEENRNLHLKTIQKKAHDEEEKLKEIAFINELEAQNRRHDSLALRQEQEERLQNIMEERQRKVDEKAAKEAAVGERKRVLEAERMEKIEKIQQKRREKEEHIGKKQQERELERLVIAREKAREREERLQAIQAAQIANVEELQKKIKKKQENMARRHEENIQHIRQKAVETGMLRNMLPEDSNCDTTSKANSLFEKKKMSSVCDFQEPLCTKYQRKKCKKIRIRLQKNGAQFISHQKQAKNEGNTKLVGTLKSVIEGIQKFNDNRELSTESSLGKLEKLISKLRTFIAINLPESKTSFQLADGFETSLNILVYLLTPELLSFTASFQCMDRIFEILTAVCENEISNIEYFISCCYFCDFLDGVTFLYSDLFNSKQEGKEGVVKTCTSILTFLEMILSCCSQPSCKSSNSIFNISKTFQLQLKDFISYSLHCGLLKKVGNAIKLASLELVQCLVNDQLIECIVSFATRLIYPSYFCKDFEDFLQATDFMGTVSLLYGHLHQTQQSLPAFALRIIMFFRTLASEQLQLFQKILGSDGFSLQFRYIAGFILQHCSVSTKNDSQVELLNHTILVIGYFALKNPENQSILQSGQPPTVLQQLIALPIQYFCEPELKSILFPTLLAICDGNTMSRESLENEMSYNHIESFLEDPISNNAELIKVLKTLENKS